MLRQIRLRNFVKFNGSQEHRLDFETNGVYIFIGENNVGKSCVFEGIRRCMKTELNGTVSARYNSDNISYVICKFEQANKKMLTSCFISIKDGNDTTFHKIVLYKSDDGNIITRSIRLITDNKWGLLKKETLSDDENRLHKICSELLDVNNKHEIDLTQFIDFCKTNKEAANDIQNDDILIFNQAFEKINFEAIFANRGISPIQSSCQIPTHAGSNDYYKSANDLAYVIKTYLKDPDKSTADGSESHYFRCLTDSQSYEFEFKDKTNKTEIVVTSNNDEDKPFSILKTPEGILESKMMSITLSNKMTTTLLIDEPGKGMHPSMIDCLRDLVLYDVNKNQAKTVIFTTHNQRFICPWTFEKIFYFKSSKSGSEVISLGHAITEKKLKSKEYLCSDQVSPIFFSKRVIMVEGPDDIRFLGTLKNIMLTDELRRSLVVKVCGGNEHTLKMFLTSLHIIAMGGKDRANEIEPLCSALKLTDRKLRYYLFDSDALLTIKTCVMPNLQKKDIEGYKLDEMENTGIFVWFAYINTIVDKFETKAIYNCSELQKYGRLEEALRQFYQTHDRKHHACNEKCEIKNCTGLEKFLNAKHLDTCLENKKIWNSNKITDIDMREIVERIIDISMKYGDDCKYTEIDFPCPFKRLLQFLINHAERSYQ